MTLDVQFYINEETTGQHRQTLILLLQSRVNWSGLPNRPVLIGHLISRTLTRSRYPASSAEHGEQENVYTSNYPPNLPQTWDFVVQTGLRSVLADVHNQHQSISQEQSDEASASSGTATAEGVQDCSEGGRAQSALTHQKEKDGRAEEQQRILEAEEQEESKQQRRASSRWQNVGKRLQVITTSLFL
ncbi:uncharacterized protein FOMMEDRAFT_150518 [Fomitiporia mediterranea MF3/22]|uniref:uncharacterized protein n=1 Tax=Fomitiporia mediterranea (strain MF3/22) TaxID=694068 RepID=UPI0004408774|nr:uncharacterized protein FOMMEDRAFT_150518 [Fomitiporia mediterranea MF3/22]EJD07926.1 hypothetical protein FOMMEDRAFT_150518 [Fomitiporia mediterranea MF3/22]